MTPKWRYDITGNWRYVTNKNQLYRFSATNPGWFVALTPKFKTYACSSHFQGFSNTCLKPPATSSLVLYTYFPIFFHISYGFPMIFPSTPHQNSWMNLAPAPSTANLPRHGASPAIHTSLSCDCGKWSVDSGMIYMSYPLVMSKQLLNMAIYSQFPH